VVNCPSCKAESADGALECAKCGVVFAKLKAIKEREKAEAAAGLEAEASPPPPDPAKFRLVAIALVVGWLVAFSLYFTSAMRDLKRKPVLDDDFSTPPAGRSR
jgi:hypothetical protein